MSVVLWVLVPIMVTNLMQCGCVETETTDVEKFKELMHQIFLQEIGEDLRRKLESISNEGVILKRTNAEIDAMVRARLTAEEKTRMRKAFEAISGPAKKFARQRVKGQPVRLTRSSQFNKLQRPETEGSKSGNKKEQQKNRNKFDL